MVKKDSKKNKLIIIVLLISSFTLLANTFIGKINLQKSNMTDVVIAKTDIPDGLEVTDAMITVTSISKNQLSSNVYTTKDEIIGKTTVVPIYKNEQISSKRITKTIESPNKNNWSIQLTPIDKALNLTENTFVDIWTIPTNKGVEKGLLPEVLFKGIKIQEMKNEAFYSKENINSQSTEGTNPIFIPEYLIFNLSEEELKSLNKLNTGLYTIRVSKYNEALLYENLKKEKETTPNISSDNTKNDDNEV